MKKRSIVFHTAALLFVLTLLSAGLLCDQLLTGARYAAQAAGEAMAVVAKWQVSAQVESGDPKAILFRADSREWNNTPDMDSNGKTVTYVNDSDVSALFSGFWPRDKTMGTALDARMFSPGAGSLLPEAAFAVPYHSTLSTSPNLYSYRFEADYRFTARHKIGPGELIWEEDFSDMDGLDAITAGSGVGTNHTNALSTTHAQGYNRPEYRKYFPGNFTALGDNDPYSEIGMPKYAAFNETPGTNAIWRIGGMDNNAQSFRSYLFETPLSVIGDVTFAIEFDFRYGIAANESRWFGFLFYYTGASNGSNSSYYRIAPRRNMNSIEGVFVNKVTAGLVYNVGSTSVVTGQQANWNLATGTASGGWHHARIEVLGRRVTMYIDYQQVMCATGVEYPTGPYSIGFTAANTCVGLDNFKLYDLEDTDIAGNNFNDYQQCIPPQSSGFYKKIDGYQWSAQQID